MSGRTSTTLLLKEGRAFVAAMATILILLIPCLRAAAQDQAKPPPGPTDNIRFGYVIHQSYELGGHIVATSGSGAMYDTLVNLQSGPRMLSSSMTLQAVDPKKALLFDRLSTSSFGYGGDPNSVSILNFSKGKLYDFRGRFRRDRQYSDYDLFANPLIPPASNPFVPVLDSPHLFNTVRRMTDLHLTLAPLSVVSGRLGFTHNVSQGPSFSTIHEGGEGLLTQFWRNATDDWTAGLDWKADHKTTFSYDQFVSHYKGDTTWQLTGLNYQLSNGTPVSLGIDLSSVWAAPCATPFAANGTVNPTCNAFLGYSRSAPTRTIVPSEQFRFQSASIPALTVNGRVLYSSANSNLTNFNEVFNGLVSRTSQRESVETGSAHVRRIEVTGDFSATWQLTPRIAATDTFNFGDFRMPGTNSLTTTSYAGTSLLVAPGAATTVTANDFQYINQKTKTNTFIMVWDVTPKAVLSGGFRYRSRIITDAGGDFIPIHEDWLLLGAVLRPTPKLRVNLNVETMYADNAFTRISPRQLQHYIVRSTYKPQTWLTFTGTINLRESRDNVQTVNHLEHNRDASFGAFISRSEKWSLDLNYAYDSIFSTTIECYASTPAPPTAGVAPAVCVAAGTPLLSTGYYNSPTQFGSIGMTFMPIKRVHLNGGYQASAINGSSDLINLNQVNGALQSRFQSPYGKVAVDIAPNWMWKASYNYYGYGQGLPAGAVPVRNFHGNIVTLAVSYAY